MARKVVEVRACDRCGKEPAHTWTITRPEGAAREIDLCDHHSAPVANAYALARASKRPGRRSAAHPAPAGRPTRRCLPHHRNPYGDKEPRHRVKPAGPAV